MGGYGSGWRRRAGAVTLAGVTLAGVTVVALGTESAQAAGSPPRSPRIGPSGGKKAARSLSPGSQDRFYAAKKQTLGALVDRERPRVERLVRDTQGVRTPESLGYRSTSAAAVHETFKAFLTESPYEQSLAHLMVIAYRPPAQQGGLPKTRLILPSVREDDAVEYIDTDESLNDNEATLTLDGLRALERQGFGLYLKRDTFLRPLEAQGPIWWPAGNRGRTWRHIEAQRAKGTVSTQILEYFYRPDVHARMLTAKDVTSEIIAFHDGKYDANNPDHVDNIASIVNELVKFGLIRDRGQRPGVTGRVHQYSALTAPEIQERDTMSLQERINQFVAPTSPSKVRTVVDLMYRNRGQVFDANRLAAEIPGLQKDYAIRMLGKMYEAELIEQVSPTVTGRKQATYKAFS